MTCDRDGDRASGVLEHPEARSLPSLTMSNHGSFQDPEEGAGFAPSFVEKPRIIPNENGTLITMKCKCKANPKPEVTWFRGTNVVKESSKISIKTKMVEEDIYELIMEIKVILWTWLLSKKFWLFLLIIINAKINLSLKFSNI